MSRKNHTMPSDSDIAALISRLDSANLEYQDLGQAQTAARARQTWPLLQDLPPWAHTNPNRGLRSSTIAVVSVNGGAGSTTCCAHLALAWQRNGKHALAIDCSPGNLLRLYLGHEPMDTRGWQPALAAGEPWHESSYRHPEGVLFLPTGRKRTPSHAEARTEDLADWLQQLPADPQRRILLDAGMGETPLARQALALAEIVIVVIRPDPASYLALHERHGELQAQLRERAWLLINGLDPVRPLDRDIAAIIRQQASLPVLPTTIHHDEFIREALARGMTVFEHAAFAQSAQDWQSVITWLNAELAR